MTRPAANLRQHVRDTVDAWTSCPVDAEDRESGPLSITFDTTDELRAFVAELVGVAEFHGAS